MALARINSATLLGIDPVAVQIEVDINRGVHNFAMVGLPDAAVRESRERVESAIRNSGFDYPLERITVNLAPADVPKRGPAFDLPIALGILVATGQVSIDNLDEVVLVGELSLDGHIRRISGALPAALGARDWGARALIVAPDNGREAAVVDDLEVYAAETLYDCVTLLEQGLLREPVHVDPADLALETPPYAIDFGDVKGQEHVKRALEVAAAGGHNMVMIGPPGSGKTMLARRLPTILPPMSLGEALEVTKLYSVSGLVGRDTALITTRPFRHPHHTVSTAGLVGGGTIPQPGEVSLAHHGVLFLDELPEFSRSALEVMRQPLEDGNVTIARAQLTLTFPASFQLVAAMNPCPCGYHGDQVKPCSCAPALIARYRNQISGPLLDRIDIHIEVPRLTPDELLGRQPGEPSAAIRARVIAARARQSARFEGKPFFSNSQMNTKALREFCVLNAEAEGLLRAAIDQFALSARAHDRILKLARTIADLDGSDEIGVAHLAEAVQYRSLDRRLWG
jgi:magnesium chelatase family protein